MVSFFYIWSWILWIMENIVKLYKIYQFINFFVGKQIVSEITADLKASQSYVIL